MPTQKRYDAKFNALCAKIAKANPTWSEAQVEAIAILRSLNLTQNVEVQ